MSLAGVYDDPRMGSLYPIAGLARSLFGGTDCAGRIICVLNGHKFACHWDDSGTDPGTEARSKSDKPILLVGGYMAHVEEWDGFTREWMPIIQPFIDKYGKKFPSFHMTEWMNSRYPYSKFSEQDFERLMAVIDDNVRMHVTWAIEIDAYLEIIKARHLGERDIVRAYHICARKCIEAISLWAKIAEHKEKILHIFHHGNSAWASFEDSFNDEMLQVLNILRPISQSEIDIVPLQAADIIAHQTARDLMTKQGMVATPRKLYVDKLISVVPGMRQYIDTKELARLYEEEVMLEQLRAIGRFPPRKLFGLHTASPEQVASMTEKMKELFKKPKDYQLRTLLAGGRFGERKEREGQKP
jgi:hypothetical protein